MKKSFPKFHSGIEPFPCESFFWKIPFWNWTTFYCRFTRENHSFWCLGVTLETPLPNMYLPLVPLFYFFYFSTLSIVPRHNAPRELTPYITTLDSKGGQFLKRDVISYLLNYSTKPLFLGENTPWGLSPYSYPWNTTTFGKRHFLLTKQHILETEKAYFVRRIPFVSFLTFKPQNWDFTFSSEKGVFVWRLFWVFERR